jgi:2-polyprenyl-3-methyl-5-hydroxy-6-metoxy-1,4-benzoquinol methylase
MTDREKLLDQAAQIKWFHAIDFGDCQSPGRFEPRSPPNKTLFGVMDMLNQIDLTGLNCLDVGTADGLIAFNMASRGAARVVATDVPAEGRPSFRAARELLNLDVELVGDTSFDNIIDKLGEHVFDVVVCAGVMYHMLNPFDCILKARRLLKRNGLLLFQTRYHAKDKRATLDFNPISRKLDQTNVFFVPSRSAVTGMLALGGFETLAVRTGTNHYFIATIARNADSSDLTGAPGLIGRQHEAGIPYPEFVSALPKEGSAAVYCGPQDDKVIDDKKYKPDFPPHPTEPKPSIGVRQLSPSKKHVQLAANEN